MEIVLNEILPQWFLTDAITTYNHSDCELKFYIDKSQRAQRTDYTLANKGIIRVKKIMEGVK